MPKPIQPHINFILLDIHEDFHISVVFLAITGIRTDLPTYVNPNRDGNRYAIQHL